MLDRQVVLREVIVLICSVVLVVSPALAKPPYVVTAKLDHQASPRGFALNSKEKLSVMYIPPALEYNFYLKFGDGLRSVIEESGSEFEIRAPQKDAETDVYRDIIRGVVENGEVDAILTHYHSLAAEHAVAPLLKKAVEKGIAVFDINSDKTSHPYPVHGVVGVTQSFETKKLGILAAELRNGRPTKVGIIEGEPGPVSERRVEGFINGIEELSNFEVVERVNGHWTTENGFTVALDMLKEHPEITVIFGVCDYSLLGASSAAEVLGRKDVLVFGYDGEPDAIDRINAGKAAGTVLIHPEEMGRVAGQMVLDLFSGSFSGGYVQHPGVIVNQENVSRYIGDALKSKPESISVASVDLPGLSPKKGDGLYWKILDSVFSLHGIDVKRVSVPHKRALVLLDAGEVDAALHINKGEGLKAVYPQWHYSSDVLAAFYSKKSFPQWKGDSSLTNQRVGWVRGRDYDRILSTEVNRVEIGAVSQGMKMVMAGRLEAYLGDLYEINQFRIDNLDMFRDNLYFGIETMRVSKKYIGFSYTPKGRYLSRLFDETLPSLIFSGELKSFYEASGYGYYPFPDLDDL